MIEMQRLAAGFYFSEIVNIFPFLEPAFDKFYTWDWYFSTFDGLVCQWRQMEINLIQSFSYQLVKCNGIYL